MIITKEILKENNESGENFQLKITPENDKERNILTEYVEELKRDFEKTLDNLHKPVTIEEAIKEATL